MTTKRKIRGRHRVADLEPETWDFLRDHGEWWRGWDYHLPDDVIRSLWMKHREAAVADYAGRHPGCRPFLWWKFDAPRLPVGTWKGCYWDGEVPEPRRLLKGSGCPLWKVWNWVPSAKYGIPDWHGDKADPPVFETQFQYLKRHGLLLPGERAGREIHTAPELHFDD